MICKYGFVTVKALPVEHIEVPEEEALEVAHIIFTDPTIAELAKAIELRMQALIPATWEPFTTIEGVKPL